MCSSLLFFLFILINLPVHVSSCMHWFLFNQQNFFFGGYKYFCSTLAVQAVWDSFSLSSTHGISPIQSVQGIRPCILLSGVWHLHKHNECMAHKCHYWTMVGNIQELKFYGWHLFPTDRSIYMLFISTSNVTNLFMNTYRGRF